MKRALLVMATAAAIVVGTMGTALAWHGIPGGTAECGRNGGVKYTFTIQNWNDANPGTVVTRLGTQAATSTSPAVFTETVNSNSDSLAWSITWEGSEEHGSGTIEVTFDGTCTPPPCEQTDRGCGAVSGKFIGPCGDPFYKAVLKNTTGAPRVFRFFYTAFGSGKAVIVRTVAAGATVSTRYVHVLGGTRLLLKSNGVRLADKTAAPAGHYGVCR